MDYMIQTRPRRFALYALTIAAGIVVSCLVLGVIGYNSNQNLPGGPAETDRMQPLDKVRLAEAYHLKEELGEEIWPGFTNLDAPVIIWNDDYEFLFGMDSPPSEWEAVPNEDFDGKLYFRRPADQPQNFAVLVGDQWAASLFTKYQLDRELIEGIGGLLPPVISEIFPYTIIIQPSEMQITGVQHEIFHVYQAVMVPEKFSEAEGAYQVDERYWELDVEMKTAWKEETELLIKAVDASTDGDAAELAQDFLIQRSQRRRENGLDESLIAYENSIEWLEGTAKYVELHSWETAGRVPDYEPLKEIQSDPDFKAYQNFERQWEQALRQTRRQAGVEGDVRFYYTGLLQAYLLDRLMPDWKDRIMDETTTLEGLLHEAIE